jgi:outer membrane receptor protein involved in Fe transport
MTVSSNRQTSVISKAVPFSELWQRTTIREKYPTFRTWDLMLRFYLNKNFVLYFNTLNVFNRESYGIDASGSPDDALEPLQQRRLVRFGVNYNMN